MAKAAANAKQQVKKPIPASSTTKVPEKRLARRLKGKYSEIDLKATGRMPEWDDVDRLTPQQISKRLAEGRYFYYYHHNMKEMRPFVVEYYGKSWNKAQLKSFNKLKDWQVTMTLASMCKMALDGAPWDEEGRNWCAKKVEEILNIGSKIKDQVEKTEEPKKAAFNIQERLQEMKEEIIGDIESFEDGLIKNKKIPAISIITWLRQKNVPQVFIKDIEEYYGARLAKLMDAMTSKDKDVQEGYRHFKKKDWDNWIKWYNSLLTDLADYKRVKATTRKVRAKKPVSPDKVVKNLKYLRYDEELKLTSVKPTEILHATQVWVYNTATRKLGVYHASDMDKELTVKGSTILGWDPKTSVAKTLRKPSEQLDAFQKSGKIQLRTFLDKVKATEVKLNGRMNDKTLILRVFK